MSKEKMNLFLKFFSQYTNIKGTYRELKDNPEERAKSTLFGKKSIIYSILSLVCAIGGVLLFAFGIQWLQSGIKNGNDVIMILVIILLMGIGISMAVYSLGLFPLAIITCIKQLSLNKRAIGWVALSILIVIVLAIAFGVLYITVI